MGKEKNSSEIQEIVRVLNELSNEDFLILAEYLSNPFIPDERKRYLKTKIKTFPLSQNKIELIEKLIRSLAVDIAKYDLSEGEIKSKINELGIVEEKVNILTNFYLDIKDLYRNYLTYRSFQIGLPKLVRIEWRYDLVRESSYAKKLNYPLFLICLTIEKNEEEQKLEFTVDRHMLRLLIQEFKEMKKVLEP
ncbi:MAG: hypothetical protein J7K36_02850 [Archaeoglobaceae archaeon]|nr:hypothetical protein [Archaeoglobaceae archaeon]